MSTTVDQAFIKQYESEVHMAYQRKGSHLRNFVRTSTKTPGLDITFQKLGKGVATSKTRHGNVVPMNAEHTNALVTLVDKYAPEYVDKLDLLKTNIDERRINAETGAWALGRFTDSQIVTVLDAATGFSSLQIGAVVSANRSALVVANMIELIARLTDRDVPSDGNIFAAVTPMVWAKMMTFQEFSNSQWVGPDALPFKTQMQAKYWAGALWTETSCLTRDSATKISKNYAWHRTAIGHGIGADIATEINYVPEKVSWLINSMLSMGAVAIDDLGIERILIDEDA